MSVTTSLMKLDDDILLLVINQLQKDDLVFALVNRRVHSLAHTRLVEHQHLLKYTLICLDPNCTHEQGCTLIVEHPVDILEVCQPGSKVFDYIKCVNIGSPAKYFEDYEYPEHLRLEGMRKAKLIPYMQDIFDRVSPSEILRIGDNFWEPMELEKLFLSRLMRPVVVQTTPFLNTSLVFSGHMLTLANIYRQCGYEAPVPDPVPSTRLVISAIESLGDPTHLTRNIPNLAMHLVVVSEGLHVFGSGSTEFWLSLGSLTFDMKIEEVDIHLGHAMSDATYQMNPYRHLHINLILSRPRTTLQKIRFCGSLSFRSQFSSQEHLNDPENQRPDIDVQVSEDKLNDCFELTISKSY